MALSSAAQMIQDARKGVRQKIRQLLQYAPKINCSTVSSWIRILPMTAVTNLQQTFLASYRMNSLLHYIVSPRYLILNYFNVLDPQIYKCIFVADHLYLGLIDSQAVFFDRRQTLQHLRRLLLGISDAKMVICEAYELPSGMNLFKFSFVLRACSRTALKRWQLYTESCIVPFSR